MISGHAAEGQQGAENTKRHGENDRKGHTPTFILRGQHEKHHKQPEPKREHRLTACLMFLV